ncbi:MAG: HDOD domain-containing protein [Desulfamplus sp.]|nr:HDOD domain-containing protein [Desulfamplus sp.]
MEKKRSLIDIIDEYVKSGKVKLPVMDQNSLLVQKEISKNDPDMDKIINLIKKDISLTTEVLKISNSPFYKGLEQVKTVQDAVIRLGMVEVTNIVLLACQKNSFRAQDPILQDWMNKMWIHSVGCAVGSQWLARYYQYDNLNEAFLAGLLHDVGAFFLLSVLDQIKAKNATMPHKLIEDIVIKMHTNYGNMLLTDWSLPEQYCTIARDHHTAEFDTVNLLLVMLRFSDKVCQNLNIGMVENKDVDIFACEEAAILDISDITIAQLQIKMEDSLRLS